VKRTFIAIVASAAALSLGCVRYGDLVEGRYADVEPSTIHASGSSSREDLPAALAALLRARLAGNADVTEEKAIEAAISIGKIGSAADGELLAELLRRDASADVRYFAADSLWLLAPAELRAIAPSALENERDAVVRGRLEKALGS
jgi:hypothetical protein